MILDYGEHYKFTLKGPVSGIVKTKLNYAFWKNKFISITDADTGKYAKEVEILIKVNLEDIKKCQYEEIKK